MNAIDTSFIQDLPFGPLSVYRLQASFDWKKLKLVFEDSERLKTKLKVWETLENDPIFQRNSYTLPMDDQRKLATLQLNRFWKYSFIPTDSQLVPFKEKMRHIMTVGQALVVTFPDVTVKYIIQIFLFEMSLLTLGTTRHKPLARAAGQGQLLAAFALTEIAHGSDAKNMKTTATYDEETQEFVINTPNFKAAKCWVGNLGKTCTISVVFAQLQAKGIWHGLHAFVVPIRNPQTLLPYPGITVGDMGEKIGLNGVDNGFVLFHNYRIPRENLLNRFADVTKEGEYRSRLSGPERLLSATLGNLSTGRVAVIQESSEYLISAVTIAVRYAATRKQFGSDDGEVPLVEYQLHQWRLFPYLSAAAVLKVFATKITDDYIEILEQLQSGKEHNLKEVMSEMHALISAVKPLTTWTCQDAIQECREACGGHGFLKIARIGDLRNANDPRVTYEGDNNILLQQTSRWLLKQWTSLKKGVAVSSPVNTCSFLNHFSRILQNKCTAKHVNNVQCIKFLEESYEWLITYLLQKTYTKLSDLVGKTESLSEAFNNSQVYRATVLSRAYAEYCVLTWYWKTVQEESVDRTLKPILEALGILYGLSSLDKHLVYFYQGDFARGSPLLAHLVKEAILNVCVKLKPNAVAVVDALAPPDFAVNSILGKSDGKIYENLEAAFFQNSDAFARPTWWKEVLTDEPDLKMSSKL